MRRAPAASQHGPQPSCPRRGEGSKGEELSWPLNKKRR